MSGKSACGDQYPAGEPFKDGSTGDTICLVADGSSGDRDLELEFARAMLKGFEVFKAKQASYGPRNISSMGLHGVAVRLNDKLQRIIRFVTRKGPDPLDILKADVAIQVIELCNQFGIEGEDATEFAYRVAKLTGKQEAYSDTWIDTGNYGFIGYLVQNGLWPE